MAEKIPLKYEDEQHQPFEAGDTLPPATVNLAALIVAGDNVTVTPQTGGLVQLDIECCGCTPDWQPTGQTRCIGEFEEIEEFDGCGNTRWVMTATPCGGIEEPTFPAVIENLMGCCQLPQGTGLGEQYFSLDNDGMAQGFSSCALTPDPAPWLPDGSDASDYELMYEHISGSSQGSNGVWFSASGGYSASLAVPGPGPARQSSFFRLHWRPTGTGEQHLLAIIEMQVAVGELCE